MVTFKISGILILYFISMETLITGSTDFFRLVTENKHAVVDKTEFIWQILENSTNASTLITRPKGFGKTINLSMLRHFLHYDNKSLKNIDIFKNFKISKFTEFCKLNKQRYAVIHIDFKGVTGKNYLELENRFKRAIRRTVEDHENILNMLDKESFTYKRTKQLLDRTADVKNPPVYFQTAIIAIMDIYGELYFSVIVLIDEYDTPFISAYQSNYSTDVEYLINVVLIGCLKSRHLHRGVVFGVHTVGEQSIIAGMKIDSVLGDTHHSPYFGFTPQDVDFLIKESRVTVNIHDLYKWYDGYQFGKNRLFNPLSVLNCLQNNGKCDSYWARSTPPRIIEQLARSADFSFQSLFDLLVKNKTIQKDLSSYLSLDFPRMHEKDFWTVLVNAGYLNAIKRITNPLENLYDLKIPNMEVYIEFMEAWRTFFQKD